MPYVCIQAVFVYDFGLKEVITWIRFEEERYCSITALRYVFEPICLFVAPPTFLPVYVGSKVGCYWLEKATW